jgi:hypothetical protein
MRLLGARLARPTHVCSLNALLLPDDHVQLGRSMRLRRWAIAAVTVLSVAAVSDWGRPVHLSAPPKNQVRQFSF